ncbi:unnamed protein product [Tuber aestivum]|uniref:Uncharacterized protein n=1 Tax=Tuber aestivum TaxID=59557 RepID=A0A292PKF1_9PEZI|nr:unnamed protein product [Tuber aestivum]
MVDAYGEFRGNRDVLAIGAGQDIMWRFENREERGGRDDVTGLHLLRPHEKFGDKDVEVALVGRANGMLEMLELDTWGRGEVLVGTILNNSSLSIYNIRQPDSVGEPARVVREASEVRFVHEQRWEISFLDHTKVVVGKASTKPIATHAIAPSGLTRGPVGGFSAKDCADMQSASVYVVEPLPKGSAVGARME